MYRSQQVTEFDIVGVAPHVDLVLFDNVISCYPCDKDITANYTLGQDVMPSSWDWIGIFRTNWRYLGEYTAYRWAQTRATDCTAPRRRAVVFPRSVHQIPANDRDMYQFLYVSHGNHVVGVSMPFKITDEEDLPDFCIATLFKEPSLICLPEKPRARKAGVPVYDTYEVINEMPGPSKPKRRAKTKEKVTAVYRDANTLVNIGNLDIADRLKIVCVHPVVQEYSLTTNNQQQAVKQLKVFDITWSKQQTPSTSTTTFTSGSGFFPKCIEYPVIQKIKAGPQSFLISLQENRNGCVTCQVAKTIVQDLVERNELQDERMRYMKLKMDAMLQLNNRKEEDPSNAVGLIDWALSQVQDDNKVLRARIDELEELLAEARSSLKEKSKTGSTFTQAADDNQGPWMIKDPKRIARIKKVLGRQSRTVQVLRQCNETKQRQITGLQTENTRLRKLVQNAFDTSDKFRELAEEMNIRIKSVLAERAKDHINEWRQFVRKQETTTQTINEVKEDKSTSSDSLSPSNSACASGNSTNVSSHSACASSNSGTKDLPKHKLRNKQISKVLKSEIQPRSKLHREQSQAEQCPTCGLKFSRKTDRRVIEEHIVFHDRMKC